MGPYRRVEFLCRFADRVGTARVFGAEAQYDRQSRAFELLDRYNQELANRLQDRDMLSLPFDFADEAGFGRLYCLKVGPFAGYFRLHSNGNVAFGALFVAALSQAESELIMQSEFDRFRFGAVA